jgi:hypothetical protein
MTITQLPARSACDILESLRYHLYGMDYYWSPAVAAGPVVFPAPVLDELGRACARLLTLLHTAATSLGPDWPERHRRLRLDPRLTSMFVDSDLDDRYVHAMARPDAVRAGDGWRIIEFNVGSALGAQSYIHVLGRAWAELYGPPLSAFRERSDPLRARAALLTRLYRDRAGAGPVAVIGFAADLGQPTSRYYDIEVQQLVAAGFDAEYVEVDEVCTDPDRYGRRFAAAVQRFVVEDWMNDGHDVTPLSRLRSAGCLVLAPQSSRILNDKRLMAALSAGAEWLGPEDRALVQRYLPWTRQVSAVTVDFEERRCLLPDLLCDARDRFVLKPAAMSGGRGVVIGHETAPAAWRQAVATAVAAGIWIAQEYVRPERVRIPLVDTGTNDVVHRQLPAIISPYIVDGGLAGGMVRFDLLDRDTILHISRAGVRLTTVAGL